MEKQRVDQIITDYLQKLYGFARKKSFSYEETDELCSDIVFEVYSSLLNADEVLNLEGYIWRISEHTYAKYVSSKKRREGISIDEMEIPYYDDFHFEDAEREMKKLRREIAFLSEIRRKIVYSFYYRCLPVSLISEKMQIPEGTVKWHLNKARIELKESLSMERKLGKLGISPLEAIGFGHSGTPGKNGGPEFYLGDKINLNIVYSVYDSPKTREEIAEELGLTPVYIEDKINLLEENGFIVKTKSNKYTTYVCFDAQTYSLEQGEIKTKAQLHIAEVLSKKYVPIVRKAIADVEDVYIPSKNRELFEAAVVFYAITNRCGIPVKNDISKYVIKTTDGGSYIASVDTKSEVSDPDYVPTLHSLPSYWACGNMTRCSEKYPAVTSWSIDTRYSSRKGAWENNLTSDYEYVYEWIRGYITENPSNAEKFARLRERNFISSDGKANIMIVKGAAEELFDKLPTLEQSIKDQFADLALECAMTRANAYPPQMQDLIINWGVGGFIGAKVALMVMDLLYADGTFKPLTEEERVSSNLIMFSDVLPKE